MAKNDVVINMKNIVKKYYIGEPNELEILHGIDLTVCDGEFVSIKVEPFDGFYLNYWSDLEGEAEQPLVREFYVDRDTTMIVYFGKYSSSSSSEPKSSSSVVPPSSSSANSSSSSARSSSSSAPKSSSCVTPRSSSSSAASSSSAKSSSSKTPKSSSSCKNCFRLGLTPAPLAPRFGVEVAGRNILITGALDVAPDSRAAGAYALFDMQGRVLRRGTVDGANFSIPVAHAGTYLVRIGASVRRVSVR